MNFSNVKLIFVREMRDQLRDRRTLFLIAVLPLLLYPLLGMSFFQLSQFLRNTAAKVVVVGSDELTDHSWLPPLLGESEFDASLFSRNPNEQKNLQIVTSATTNPEAPGVSPAPALTPEQQLKSASAAITSGDIQVVLYFPPGFGERLLAVRQSLLQRSKDDALSTKQAEWPKPQIISNSANEKSRIAQLRVDRVLRAWRHQVMQTNLRDSHVPMEAAQPFEVLLQDVAEEQQRDAAIWSKILPFILFIWALTGAFYPAVDLCAGEKERGTLETLLVSPAQRREIVWGKLLTVMTFSVVTALLNLGSMGLTGKFVLSQFQEMAAFSGQSTLSMPPLISVVWLVAALLPVAALFSALCLACAAFARSSKEGQYYLMPLLLIVMPLMLLPMSPGVELNLGNSLIPVTGVVLLLRSMIEGQYWQALPYLAPVVIVTLLCCLLAIRWAEEQFNSESVLFRESERLDLGRWLVHLVRDRADTPTFAQGILCVVVITVVQFFVNLALSAQGGDGASFAFLAKTIFASQVVCIAFPAILMALLFTRKPLAVLKLNQMPRISHLASAALLAVLMFPLGQQLAFWISRLYPYSPEVEQQMLAFAETLQAAPYWWLPLLLIAVLPAICEEIAFRGFILSGFRHLGHKWWAIGLTAIVFGMAHFVLQQKISAAAVGVVIGLLAVQTGSIFPCMLFHALYNGLNLVVSNLVASSRPALAADSAWFWILSTGEADEGRIFQPWVLALCLIGVMAALWRLNRLPYQHTDEERLQEARERNLANA